jgi:hypothetical protein
MYYAMTLPLSMLSILSGKHRRRAVHDVIEAHRSRPAVRQRKVTASQYLQPGDRIFESAVDYMGSE